MPLYQYTCRECENTVDILHKIDYKEEIKCKGCGHSPMRKDITGVRQFEFKGEGTYTKGKTSHGKL